MPGCLDSVWQSQWEMCGYLVCAHITCRIWWKLKHIHWNECLNKVVESDRFSFFIFFFLRCPIKFHSPLSTAYKVLTLFFHSAFSLDLITRRKKTLYPKHCNISFFHCHLILSKWKKKHAWPHFMKIIDYLKRYEVNCSVISQSISLIKKKSTAKRR